MKSRKAKSHKHPFLNGLFWGGIFVIVALGVNLFRQPKAVKIDPTIARYTPPGAVAPSGFRQIPSFLPAASSISVPILLYHYIEANRDPNDTIRTSLAVTPYWFEKQLQYLRDHNYQTITFSDLHNAIKRGAVLPQKPVILTFDDGYRDFYTDAWPLLKKYRAKATIFVVPGFLDKHNYLFSWQLTEIVSGPDRLVTLGAHTMHHMALPSLKEIIDSKRYLEDNFGQPVTVFAYPYGMFNNPVKEDVRRSGFQMAVSTLFGKSQSSENLFTLPRIRVGNYAGETFAKRLEAKP